jgi:hypothetical protein
VGVGCGGCSGEGRLAVAPAASRRPAAAWNPLMPQVRGHEWGTRHQLFASDMDSGPTADHFLEVLMSILGLLTLMFHMVPSICIVLAS